MTAPKKQSNKKNAKVTTDVCGNCPTKCNKPNCCKNEQPKVIELSTIDKAKNTYKEASRVADSLQKMLMTPDWLRKYKHDPLVIMTYSYTVRKLRSAVSKLKDSFIFLENRSLIKNIKNAYDSDLVELLENLNKEVEDSIKSVKESTSL